MSAHRLSRRIAHVLDLRPEADAVEYDGRWSSWAQLGDAARRVAELTTRYGGDTPQVGILLRNRPPQLAALLGVLLAGGTVVVINPSRGDDRTRADIADLALPVLIGDRDDLDALVTPAPTTTLLCLRTLAEDAVVDVAARGPCRNRGPASRCGCSPAAPPDRPSAST